MDEWIKLIDRLAASLGTTSERLLEIYKQRAPLEWVDVWITGGIFVLALISWIVVIIKYEANDDWYFLMFITMVLSLITAVVCGFQVSEAYKAINAPDAYAVDALINSLKSLR